MPTVSWPITLSGDYTDGSVCKASDYKNDFEKLRDGLNQLHERFNTLAWSCSFQKPLYHLTENSGGSPRLLMLSGVDDDDYVVLGAMKVPSWCQAVRLRNFQITSHGCFDYGDTSENVAQGIGGTFSSDEKIRMGVATSGNLAEFTSNTLESAGASILTYIEKSGADLKAFIDAGSVGATRAFQYDEVLEGGLSTQVVNAGEFIVVFARLYDSSTGTGVVQSLLPNADARHWINLQATLLFDCLAPIP
jgi:hypothetical protein